MLTEINTIARQFFQKDSLESVSGEDLKAFIDKYPYNASARLLLAQKSFEEDKNQHADELLTAGLYFSNPLWLDHLLTEERTEPVPENIKEDKPSEAMVAQPQPVEPPAPPAGGDAPIIFQSYHTIDYFASQGIRLQQADLTKDRFGQQLKSFTDWLRSMKKLPATQSPIVPQDEAGQQHVIRNAEASIREKEVVTEAMAEVWSKQGHPEKAIEIYNKLSLLDPSKSAYFATKIDQLK